MQLKITLKKWSGKPSVLTIYRTDGSYTWSKLHRGLETHDLAHFAVESNLGFTEAFYGIIDKGFNIGDFTIPRDRRPEALLAVNLHPEAIMTEHIVNLLEVERNNTGFNPDLLKDLKKILNMNRLPYPQSLDENQLNKIRTLYNDLANRWLILQDGEELSIDFIT